MTKRILITGGAGFIGSNLIKALGKGPWEIVVLDALIKQVHPMESWDVPPGVTFYHGDVRDPAMVAKAMDGVDFFVHLAAETGVGQSAYELARYVGTNEYGTAVVLEEAARQPSLKGVILASSRAVYGEGGYVCRQCGDVFPEARPLKTLKTGQWDHVCPICKGSIEPRGSLENQPLKPTSCYAITKHNQEQLVELFALTHGVPAVALRFQNVYGPGQSLTNPYTGILSIFSTRVTAGNPILIYEDGQETRDFVFIDDVIQSICLPLEKGFTGYGVYNVGTGRGTSVLNIAEILVKLMKSKASVEIVGKYRVGDIRHAWADLTRIQQDFGYAPGYSVEAGLKLFVEWAAGQPAREDGYEVMEREMAQKGFLGKKKDQ